MRISFLFSTIDQNLGDEKYFRCSMGEITLSNEVKPQELLLPNDING